MQDFGLLILSNDTKNYRGRILFSLEIQGKKQFLSVSDYSRPDLNALKYLP